MVATGSDLMRLALANDRSTRAFEDRGRFIDTVRDLDDPDSEPYGLYERPPNPNYGDRTLAASFVDSRLYGNRDGGTLTRPQHHQNRYSRSRFAAHDTGMDGREHFVDHGTRDGGRNPGRFNDPQLYDHGRRFGKNDPHPFDRGFLPRRGDNQARSVAFANMVSDKLKGQRRENFNGRSPSPNPRARSTSSSAHLQVARQH